MCDFYFDKLINTFILTSRYTKMQCIFSYNLHVAISRSLDPYIVTTIYMIQDDTIQSNNTVELV